MNNSLTKKIELLETQINDLIAPISKKILKSLKIKVKESAKDRETERILYSSLDVLEREGLQSLLHHTMIKLKRKEFRILDPNIFPSSQPKQFESGWNSYLIEEKTNQQSFEEMIRDCENMKKKPKISIVMPVYNSNEKFLREAIESVKNQIYKNWELNICDDGSKPYIMKILKNFSNDKRIKICRNDRNSGIAISSNKCLEMATGEFIALLDHDDILTENALYEVVKVINRKSSVDYIYSDEDHLSENGHRLNPYFKPNWSPELLRSIPYLSHLTVFKKSIIDSVGGFNTKFSNTPDYDLQLKITDKANSIMHIPKILYSWRSASTSASNAKNIKKFEKLSEENFKELQNFISKKNIGTVQHSFYQNIFRVRYNLLKKPLTSIIILTMNNTDFLKKCLSSIKKSSYKNLEIIIVTNNPNPNSEMWKYLRSLPYKILKFENEFNWSEMNNFGVKNSLGEYLIFLNDDTEVINDDWIECMLEFAQQKDVGAVGCKLLFSDKRIQHVGVAGDPIYVAYHPLKDTKGDGYYSMAILPHEVSAVTGACMMVRRETFEKVGGFDEQIQIVLNDIDLCWKLRNKGYRNVYTPFASLYHHEGSSRYVSKDPNNAKTTQNTIDMLRKWRNFLSSGDPYHNYNLINARIDTFGLAKLVYPKPLNEEAKGKQILMISHNLNLEGATLGLYKITKYLRSKGFSVTVISPYTGKLLRKYNEIGISVNVIPHLGHLCKIKNHDLLSFLHSFDIIFANTMPMYFIGNSLKEPLFGITSKVIWIVRETPKVEELCNELKIEKSTLSKSFTNPDKVVFLSNATRNYYNKFEGNNFITINDCVDLEEFKNGISNPTFSLLPNYFNVICVGTIYDKKGQDVLVDAARELKQKHGFKNFRFFIIGKVGNQEFYHELTKKIKKYGLKEIIFLGELSRDQVYSYYKNCDAVVLPSRSESFPTSVTEAMALGKPVIASKIFGTVEQIKDGHDGILIESDNVEELTKALISLYQNKSLREKLSKNSHTTFLEKFSYETMGDRYVSLIRELCGSDNAKKAIMSKNQKLIDKDIFYE